MFRSLLLPTVTLLTGPFSHAQSWCASGAQWVYGLEATGVQGYSRFHYDGDTTLHDTLGQRIGLEEVLVFPPDPQPVVSNHTNAVITAHTADVVSTWDELSESWDTLFWFGAQVGDFWAPAHYQGECGDTERLLVEAIGTEVVDGTTLRWLELANGRGRIMERAGWYWNLEVGPSCLIVEGLSGMRCYTDDALSYTPASWGQDCFAIGMDDATTNLLTPPYPNPGTDVLVVDLGPAPQELTLLDAIGRVVATTRGNGRITLDTSDLPDGAYLLTIVARNGAMEHHPWYKSK